MILVPIGRDDAVIQRHAYVSYAIIALCVAAWLCVAAIERNSVATRIDDQYREVIRYIYLRPYLRMPESVRNFIPEQLQLAIVENRQNIAVPPDDVVAEEQKKLDSMAERVMTELHRLPRMRFGYIPASGGIVPLFASMFLHAGFLHLLGNLLFFFATGPFIEDVFGRPLFAALYLSGGIVATLTYAWQHPYSAVPLVGASGAIAAIMGAYLVRFWKSKLEFLFVPFLFRPQLHFRFFVPAFIVLPLWFLQQAWQMAGEASSGIAFSAHVGGFVYGLAVAIIVGVLGFEQKYVAPVVEKQTSWKVDDRVVHALDARAQGDLASARQQLEAVLRSDGGNIEALRAAVDVAKDLDDAKMLDGAAARLLGRYAEEKQHDLAWELVQEFAKSPMPRFLARAASFAERQNDREWALALYQRLCDLDPNSTNTVGSLIKIGTLLKLSGDANGARTALTRARTHPACTAEWAPAIDAKLAQLSGPQLPRA